MKVRTLLHVYEFNGELWLSLPSWTYDLMVRAQPFGVNVQPGTYLCMADTGVRDYTELHIADIKPAPEPMELEL